MSKHTPGPWNIRPHDVESPILISEGKEGYRIATVWPDDSGLQEADARLVAAAPDLLEALKEHLVWYEGGAAGLNIDENRLIQRTRNAIAKAEGKDA